MFKVISSISIWFAVIALILLWLPLLGIIYVFDRDPVKYRTGRWFRRLGMAITKVNPTWKLQIDGYEVADPRKPYIVVSNHQSMADIPLISHLPWEMKWIAKKELFDTPVVGWMMKMAGDISVDRKADSRRAQSLIETLSYLKKKCSVMFFPEGTRSLNGKVHRFNDGAFLLAIKAGVPVLPLVLDGSRDCLPKHSWKFGKTQVVKLRVLEPIETEGMNRDHVAELREETRQVIIKQIAEWRDVPLAQIDGLSKNAKMNDQ
jgi:1-acyl-sn-glycerol-3-phosphate acyltransferase